jgi:hypothetical protein
LWSKIRDPGDISDYAMPNKTPNLNGNVNCKPLSLEFPKVDEPGTSMDRLKRSADGECQRVRIVETAAICHGRGGNEGNGHAMIGADVVKVCMKKC